MICKNRDLSHLAIQAFPVLKHVHPAYRT
jgi:hypothetical protein